MLDPILIGVKDKVPVIVENEGRGIEIIYDPLTDSYLLRPWQKGIPTEKRAPIYFKAWGKDGVAMMDGVSAVSVVEFSQ